MISMRHVRYIVTTLLASSASSAWADFSVGVYFGRGYTGRSDVRLREPGGTDLSVNGVVWRDRSFTSPVYYGVRLSYFASPTASNGLMLDFTHTKMYADPAQTVSVSGTRNGTPASGKEPLAATFSELSLSHGYNLLVLNLLHRWSHGSGGGVHTFSPYAGAGIGIAVPHVEVRTAGGTTDDYRFGGVAYQALAGVNYTADARWDLFTEYKLSYGDIEADLNSGGRLRVSPLTHHLTVGGSLDVH
jgi:lipid A oxidase